MAFIGRKPTNAPLTSSDLGTGIVGSTNIADGAITESKFAAGANDDEDIKYDLATLALQQASDANKAAYALPNTFIDQFEDSTGIDVQTNTSRNASEYVGSINLTDSGWTNINLNQAYINAISGVSGGSDDFLGATELAAVGNLGTGNYTQVANTSIDQFAVVAPLSDLNASVSFGTGYKWQVAMIQKNGNSAYQMGMSYNANLNQMTNLNGATTNTSQGTSNGGDYAISNSVFGINYENAGGALRYRPAGTGFTITTAGSVTGDSGLYWDYDGDATSLKITRWNLGSTSADSVLNQYVVNDQSVGGRTLPSSGRPVFSFGHHNHSSTANQFQLWTKYSSGANSATGNFTSVSQTAPGTVSKMGIVVLYKNNAGTATLNTDLIAQVSANGGTNYSTVTLTPRGTFSTGINIATAAAVSVTSGTSCKYKISFANQSSGSKDTQVYGVALQY